MAALLATNSLRPQKNPCRIAKDFRHSTTETITAIWMSFEFTVSPAALLDSHFQLHPKKTLTITRAPEFRLLFEPRHHKYTCNFDITAFLSTFRAYPPREEGGAKAAMKIRGSIHRLLLGVSLIALASGVLLLSDWSHRRSGGSLLRRVAVFQHVSQPVLDEGIEGMLDAIAESGFIDGQNIEIRRFNAENDLPTANAIAKQITNGEFDLLLTASTLSLQTVANRSEE